MDGMTNAQSSESGFVFETYVSPTKMPHGDASGQWINFYSCEMVEGESNIMSNFGAKNKVSLTGSTYSETGTRTYRVTSVQEVLEGVGCKNLPNGTYRIYLASTYKHYVDGANRQYLYNICSNNSNVIQVVDGEVTYSGTSIGIIADSNGSTNSSYLTTVVVVGCIKLS